MLPRLEAEEAIERINTTAAGTGSMRKDALRRVVADYERSAQGPRRPKAAKAAPEALGVMGIGLRVQVSASDG